MTKKKPVRVKGSTVANKVWEKLEEVDAINGADSEAAMKMQKADIFIRGADSIARLKTLDYRVQMAPRSRMSEDLLDFAGA